MIDQEFCDALEHGQDCYELRTGLGQEARSRFAGGLSLKQTIPLMTDNTSPNFYPAKKTVPGIFHSARI